MASNVGDRHGPWRVVGGVMAVAALWVVLAVLRPEVTYHLGPALVVWAGPCLAGRSESRALLATGGSAVFALTVALLLSSTNVLRGPAIVGADALGEAIIVTVSAAAIAVLGIGLRRWAGADADGG